MFLTLLIKVLPLYLLIAIGYFAGRFAQISDRQIADYTIHFIAPFVLFSMAWQMQMDAGQAFGFIIIVAILTLIMAGASYVYGDRIWGDKRKNLFSNQILGANTGYFGIPVAFALFASSTANSWILIIMVSTILHTSLGYYILATGNLSPLDGLKKLLKLPLFWSMIFGFCFSLSGITWVEGFNETLNIFKGAYFVMGMGIIGLSIARISRVHFDVNYILHTMLWRFGVWIVAALFIIYLDARFTGILTDEYRSLIILYACMPLPANSVAYAAQLNVHPQKAASAVLASTLFALIYIPVVFILFENAFF